MSSTNPFWLQSLFVLITIICILFFYHANGRPRKLTIAIVAWSLLHAILACLGFYQNLDGFPPRFALVLLPTTAVLIYSLFPKPREWMIQNRNLDISTFSHIIRIPVEISLYYLFVYKMVPELMTFEGRNFDIIAGITAPVFAWFWIKGKISNSLMIIWNFLGLCLVSFILINGLLSAELPFQQFGFEQPNKAVELFPYILLPATIVPIVFYTHMTDIVKLIAISKT